MSCTVRIGEEEQSWCGTQKGTLQVLRPFPWHFSLSASWEKERSTTTQIYELLRLGDLDRFVPTKFFDESYFLCLLFRVLIICVLHELIIFVPYSKKLSTKNDPFLLQRKDRQ